MNSGVPGSHLGIGSVTDSPYVLRCQISLLKGVGINRESKNWGALGFCPWDEGHG